MNEISASMSIALNRSAANGNAPFSTQEQRLLSCVLLVYLAGNLGYAILDCIIGYVGLKCESFIGYLVHYTILFVQI